MKNEDFKKQMEGLVQEAKDQADAAAAAEIARINADHEKWLTDAEIANNQEMLRALEVLKRATERSIQRAQEQDVPEPMKCSTIAAMMRVYEEQKESILKGRTRRR